MMNMPNQKISQKIIYECKKQSLTISKLAKLSRVSSSTISEIIKGTNQNPRMKTLIKISKGLGLSLKEFFTF